MTATVLPPSRLYAMQNGLAAMLVTVLLAAELLRYLLAGFPGVELFWRLSSLSNTTVGPLLNALGGKVPSPTGLLAVLVVGLLLPLVAWRKRHWLGTAVAGHLTLACLGLLSFWAVKRNNTGQVMASLADVFEPRLYDTSAMTMLALSAIMAALCFLNHVAFFRR